MKFSVKPQLLKCITLAAGGVGLALRAILYATGTDEKGLLMAGHWAGISLTVLTLAVVAGLFVLTRPIKGPEEYPDAFPVSIWGGAGALAAGLCTLISAVTGFSAVTDTIGLLVQILGLIAGAGLILTGLCRSLGAKPNFLLHTALCLYFAVRMVSQYRSWSSDPQLMDYCFYLCAFVCLMLTAYQFAAFDAGFGSHRSLWFTGLLGVYFCCLSLSGPQDVIFILACGIWAFTNLTSLSGRPRRKRPTLQLDQEEA